MNGHAIRTPRSGQRREGFSLIEVLVAMAILAIAIIALANLFLLSIRKNARSGEQSRLAVLAQDKLEELFALDYFNAALAPGNYTDVVTLDVGSNSRKFDRAWTIQQNVPEPNTKTITVTMQGFFSDTNGDGVRDPGENRGYIGRSNLVRVSLIKVGPLGGAVTRN